MPQIQLCKLVYVVLPSGWIDFMSGNTIKLFHQANGKTELD